jgi:hypothetical protein
VGRCWHSSRRVSLMLRSRRRDNDTDRYELEAQSKQVAVRRLPSPSVTASGGLRYELVASRARSTTIDTIMPTAVRLSRALTEHTSPRGIVSLRTTQHFAPEIRCATGHLRTAVQAMRST